MIRLPWHGRPFVGIAIIFGLFVIGELWLGEFVGTIFASLAAVLALMVDLQSGKADRLERLWQEQVRKNEKLSHICKPEAVPPTLATPATKRDERTDATTARERTLYRVYISRRDFTQALYFIDAAKNADESTAEFEALMLAAIMCYARPFSPNEKDNESLADSRLDGTNLPTVLGADLVLHKRILLLRNKVVAHSESAFNPMKLILPFIEESTEVQSSGIAFMSQSWHVLNELTNLDAFRRIADALNVQCLNLQHDLGRAIATSIKPDR